MWHYPPSQRQHCLYSRFFSFTLGVLGAVALPMAAHAQSSQPTITCGYDPNSGVPNPFGMRAFITLEERQGDTRVIFEQFPSAISGPAEATVELARTVTFYRTSIDQARQLLLNNSVYYNQLVGRADPEGFAAINALLVCRAGAVTGSQPRPTNELPNLSSGPTGGRASSPAPDMSRTSLPDLSGTVPTPARPASDASGIPYDTIATLPDGNYRYWSGQTGASASALTNISDATLIQRGGALFLFQKTGSTIIGRFSYIDSDSICIQGRVSGNTISGTAATDSSDGRTLGESFESWGPGGFMKVRRASAQNGRTTFGGAILDLNGFSRINAGNSLPPEGC